MQVPFLDLREINSSLQTDFIKAFENFLLSGQYVLGDQLAQFEKNFSTYCGATNAIGVGNGLDAIVLGLKALDVGVGDEVIVPANTFIATWLAVSICGATPIPVEPEFVTFNIDVSKIEASISKKTKAIIPVHLFGRPADLDAIKLIAVKYGLAILEDGAQAHGAFYKGRPIGSHGNIVAWSFYPGKNLGALGDAGALTTSSIYHAEEIRALRNYGSHEKYVSDVLGFNSRLDPLQASLLILKLKKLNAWNDARKLIAKRYIDGISCKNLILPDSTDLINQAWHLFVIRHPKRDHLRTWLQERGVECGIHYPIPPHLQKAFKFLGYCQGSFPITELMASSMLSLPMGPHLNDEQINFVIDAVNDYGRLN